MRIKRFPVLTADDRDFVRRLEVGLGEQEAQVLGYLLLREEAAEFGEEPATLLSVRIGTDLARSAAKTALSSLVEAGLVTETTADTDGQGRPPTAWRVESSPERLLDQVYSSHARDLLDRAREFTAAQGATGGTASGFDEEYARRAITVSLNWQPNGLQAPLYAARERGAYADRDLSIAFEPRTGSGAALRAVATGESLLGIIGSTTLIRAVAQGAPVVPLALLYQRALAVLYTTRDAFGEPFERVAQLRGRRIGMPVGSEIGLLGRLYLRQAGVADDVTVVDLRGEERTALLTGQVDVVTGSLSDPARIGTAGTTVDTIPIAEKFPIYGPALVARQTTLETNPSLLADFLAGTMVGVAEAQAEPAVAASAIDGNESAARARRTFEDAIETGWTSEAVDAHGWGWHQTEDWERLRGVLDQVELLDS